MYFNFIFVCLSILITFGNIGYATSLTLDAGKSHTCAIDAQQEIQCWGTDFFGQSSPPVGKFIQVTTGMNISCGIRDDNELFCWGNHEENDIPGNPEGKFIYVKLNKASSVSVCAVTIDNRITCWGKITALPENTLPEDGDYIEAYVGSTGNNSPGHVCALRKDRTVACWGNNTEPFVGNTVMQGMVPEEIKDKQFITLDVGGWHNCGILAETQKAYCWGLDSDTQSTPPDVKLLELSVGTYTSCGITEEHLITCWGWFGIENPLIYPPNAKCECISHPEQCICTQQSGTQFKNLATFTKHICAVDKTNDHIVCWGENLRGQAVAPANFIAWNAECAENNDCENYPDDGNTEIPSSPCHAVGLKRQATTQNLLFSVAPEDLSMTFVRANGLKELTESPHALTTNEDTTYFATSDAIYLTTDPEDTESYTTLKHESLQAIQDISMTPSGDLWGWDNEAGLWSITLDSTTKKLDSNSFKILLAPPDNVPITHLTWHVSQPILFGLQQGEDAASILWSYQPDEGQVGIVCPEVVADLPQLSDMTVIGDSLLMFTTKQLSQVYLLETESCQIIFNETVLPIAPTFDDIAGLVWQCR